MKYFLATYEILDGEHEHKGAIIFEAESYEVACQLAEAEEFDPVTDNARFYFSFCGDGLIACKNKSCHEITQEQMAFLEKVGLAYRK
jgi:hypothetical protein